jgi:hypothetical protein
LAHLATQLIPYTQLKLRLGIPLLVDFQVSTYTKSIRTLMEKYSSVPMSLADACLVKMTELHENSVVMTLDGDFRIYRRNGRQTIPVLMPSELC